MSGSMEQRAKSVFFAAMETFGPLLESMYDEHDRDETVCVAEGISPSRICRWCATGGQAKAAANIPCGAQAQAPFFPGLSSEVLLESSTIFSYCSRL